MGFDALTTKQDIKAIEELLKNIETQIADEFLDRVREEKSSEKISLVRDYLEAGRIDLALEVLDDDDSGFLTLFLSVWLAASTLQIGMQTTDILDLYRHYYPVNVPLTKLPFDATNPRHAELVRQIGAQILDTLRQRKRESIYYIINEGIRNGLSAKEISLQIERFAGLSAKQIESTLNYERLLRAGSKEVLNRSLRDPNFDRLINSGRALSEKQIQTMVGAYIRKQLIYRAEVIGNQIAGDLAFSAFEESTKQTLQTLGIPEDEIVKTWRSMRDGRVRFTHKPHVGMDGQIVGINERFRSPSGATLAHPRDGSAPLSEIAGCRCWMIVGIGKPNR